VFPCTDHVVATFAKLTSEFVDEAISELAISEDFRDLVRTAQKRAVEILEAVQTG
jgi:hypothetical protein